MSDYKILHKRHLGKDTWQVFYNGCPLVYYHPEVKTPLGALEVNPYKSLDNAKRIIKAHKEYTQWAEDEKKRDVTEWLDDEGNFLKESSPNYVVVPARHYPTRKVMVGWMCAIAWLLILFTLTLIFT